MIYSPLLEGFLLGIIATSSVIAAIFFLRFWKETRDSLFLAFALAFAIEGVNRGFRIFYAHPSEASPWVFLVRACAFLIILGGIVNKNRQSSA